MEFYKPLSQEEESQLLHEFSTKAETINMPRPNMTHPGTPVSTMIRRGKFNGTKYHVPSFANHWGVIVGDTIYHITYHARQTIVFTWEYWEKEDSPSYNIRRVGTTHYIHEELTSIGNYPPEPAKLTGKAMFAKFGPYHRKAWNCQIFAKIFLKAVCIEPWVEFNTLTLLDAERVV
jgi:hypothetical protein